jgi:hypothetical protein
MQKVLKHHFKEFLELIDFLESFVVNIDPWFFLVN